MRLKVIFCKLIFCVINYVYIPKSEVRDMKLCRTIGVWLASVLLVQTICV